MRGTRFLIVGGLLSLAALGPALAVQPWMPDRPDYPEVRWDVPQERPADCTPAGVTDRLLLGALSSMAGIPAPEGLVCPGEAAQAWTLPPGGLAMTGELLKLPYCQKAFVLGHEVTHLALRHAEETAAALRALGHLRSDSAADALAAADYDLSLWMRLMPLFRAQEREADRVGAMLAAAEGCSLAESAIAFLRGLPPVVPGSFMESHDTPAQRIAALRPFAPSVAAILKSEPRARLSAASAPPLADNGFRPIAQLGFVTPGGR